MSSSLSDRLNAVGLTIALPAEGSETTNLMELIGTRGLLQPIATRPANAGANGSRILELAKAAGISGLPNVDGAMTAVALLTPFIKPNSLSDILQTYISNNQYGAEQALAVARGTKDPSLLPLFKAHLTSDRDAARVEALIGYAECGGGSENAKVLATALKDDDDAVVLAGLSALYATGSLAALNESGELENYLSDGDHSEMATGLVSMCLDGTMDAFADTASNGWEAQVGLFRLATFIGLSEGDTPEGLFEALVEQTSEISDSDAVTVWVWATAACAPSDYSAVEALLEAADNCSNGNHMYSGIMAAIGSLCLSDEDRKTAAAALCELDLSDTDDKTSRRIAVRRLDPGQVNKTPGAKFGSTPGYSRLENFFGNPTGSPSAEELLNAGPNSSVTGMLRAVKANEASLQHMSLMTAAAIHFHPEISPALAALATQQNQPGDTRKACAGALLIGSDTTTIPAVLTRCLLGADAGGPMNLAGEEMGALLAMLADGDTCAQAITLIAHGSVEQRAVARGYLDHKLNVEKTSDTDYRKARVSAGGIFTASATPLWKTQPVLAAALDFPIPVEALLSAMKDDPATIKRIVNGVVTGGDRQKSQNMARCAELFAETDPSDLFGTFMGMANDDGWIPRETAGIFAQTIGARIMASDDSDAFSEKLVELCDDSDSDVTREANAACAVLGLEA